jgi:hypothetical protein
VRLALIVSQRLKAAREPSRLPREAVLSTAVAGLTIAGLSFLNRRLQPIAARAKLGINPWCAA